MKALSIFLLAMLPLVSAAQPASCRPETETFLLPLRGTSSRAEILMPPSQRPLAVMVMIHGSDVADLDNSVVGADGAIVSTPLKDVAIAMACAGIATIRYDKRFVSGPSKVDRAEFDKSDLRDFLADAELALENAKTRPALHSIPEFVFGWSEGTTVAAALAVKRPSIRAVILQAPVLPPFAQTLPIDFPRVGAPYLMRYAKDGQVDAAAIALAGAGPGGVIAQIYVNMFKGFAPGERVNPLLDTNHDGAIDILHEAGPVIAGWFADVPNGGLGIYASAVALPDVRAQLSRLKIPLLIVQGESDGAIDEQDARRLRDEKRPGITVKLYPGLGHTLGPSASPIEDHFLPIAAKPLQDMADWAVRIARLTALSPSSRQRLRDEGKTAHRE